MINAILGEITVELFGSVNDMDLIQLDYIPDRFTVKFIKLFKKNGKTTFNEKINDEYDDIISVDEFRDSHDYCFIYECIN